MCQKMRRKEGKRGKRGKKREKGEKVGKEEICGYNENFTGKRAFVMM